MNCVKIVMIINANAIHAVGDIVEWQPPHVQCEGAGYRFWDVIEIETMTFSEVDAILRSKIPETITVYKTLDPANVWGLNSPSEKMVWKDENGVYKGIKFNPHLALNLILSEEDKSKLGNPSVSKAEKTAILSRATENLSKYPQNHQETLEING